MARLSSKYLGLELRSPLIVGAAGLTADMDALRKIEEAGAGAVVIRTLFEEEIEAQRFAFDESVEHFNHRSPEMISVMPRNLEHSGPEEHLVWVRKAVDALSIPVIASLNAVHPQTWVEYAQKLEQSGASALELNLYTSPGDGRREGAEIEREHIEAAGRVVAAVRIPVSAKLSPFYTSPVHIIRRLAQQGVRGMVLFNALLQPTIDVDTQNLVSPFNYTDSNDSRTALRIVGLTYGTISADLCAAGGIRSGEDIARMLLAGAGCVQVVSALYHYGINHIIAMLARFSDWADKKGYASVEEVQGKLSRHNSRSGWVYDRAQYAKLLLDAAGQIPQPVTA